MSISSFKLSKPLEARRDEATRIIEKDPQKIPVIVEKIRESDVPDINEHMYSVSAKQRIGQFVAEFHTKLNLGADKTIFLFVKNTVIPNGKGFGSNEYALMSEIYEEHKDEDGFLYMSYSGEDILSATKTSLIIADSILHEHPNGHTLLESLPLTWKPLLSTLEKLVSISGSNEKMKKRFEQIIKQWKEIFCRLLICFSEKGDIPWLMKLKEFTTFDVRKHLVQILFPRAIPQTEEDLEDAYFPVEVIRETLFQDSFDQIMAVNKWDFSAGISVEFLDEEAQGFGVLREWFSLVCKHLFEPENHLFIGCPDDPRRFSPDPHPFRFEENYLQKYRFAGRIIALALKHEVQVGFLFEPLFFHYLCGKQCFSWRDLIHTDLELHRQFKQMLEMDAEEFDATDGFGLTFEGFSLNDDKKKVTSENREQYVQCRMDQRYNHHISDLITQFRIGVEDIIDGVNAENLFGSLKLEDLDSMLRGLEDDYINVLEWMEVTVYDNYQATDNVVMCFWRVVCQMNQEQLHNLLCFWTAHRFLPRDGFHGLPRFCISRMYTGEDPTLKNKYKPTSHTCFYSLQLPDYDTYEDTEAALRFITQENCGFGAV